jgi:hypothetical protein
MTHLTWLLAIPTTWFELVRWWLAWGVIADVVCNFLAAAGSFSSRLKFKDDLLVILAGPAQVLGLVFGPLGELIGRRIRR